MGFIKKFERVILADMIFSLIVLIMAFMGWHSENIFMLIAIVQIMLVGYLVILIVYPLQIFSKNLDSFNEMDFEKEEMGIPTSGIPFEKQVYKLVNQYAACKTRKNNAQILDKQTELTALQSQINPHFLYNTLESITWMIEAQKNEEAVIMISELAKLLRVSLSRGKTIIPVKDELQHSRSYMNIQLVRYKERFQMEFQTDKEIEDYCIVKLVIQPILENAIYYGVGNMDEDDEGKITVRGEKKEDDIYITIEDNGMGMRKEVLENILKDNNKVPKHGSGVGVINVHSRIQLMFGEQYGLEIYSEPDEGTRVVIHIPAIPYTKENAEQLEMQKYTQGRDVDEKE